ncbi:hypothetical protein PY97_04575 [Lacticaseibacillus rhamnosus]|nr:hypothetical protein PY97_04575 [Lacticaseibacillus rhamnosus]
MNSSRIVGSLPEQGKFYLITEDELKNLIAQRKQANLDELTAQKPSQMGKARNSKSPLRWAFCLPEK